MVKQVISTGTTANDGTGDTLRSAGTKINENFTELYNRQVLVTETQTKSDSAMKITPMAMGYTDSQDAYGNIRVSVQNRSAGTSAVAVTIKALKLSL